MLAEDNLAVSDEELARRLHDAWNGENAARTSGGDEAASVALALMLNEQERQAQEAGQVHAQNLMQDDAALAAALSAADSPDVVETRDDEAASLALAIQLSEAPSSRRAVHTGESEELRQHLFSGSGAPTCAAHAPASAPPPPAIVSSGGPSFASVVGDAQLPQLHQRMQTVAAATASHGATRSTPTPVPAPSRSRSAGPQLVIDGANVAYSFGQARGFDAEGIVRCVAYFAERSSSGGSRGIPLGAIAVTMNESRYDATDPALQWLEAAGLLAWTPVGKDDDVFLLQSAADHNAWVVTNDRWTDHRPSRHATQEVRRRVLRYTFVAGAFAPASDDLGRFDAR